MRPVIQDNDEFSVQTFIQDIFYFPQKQKIIQLYSS